MYQRICCSSEVLFSLGSNWFVSNLLILERQLKLYFSCHLETSFPRFKLQRTACPFRVHLLHIALT